ncbi:MAG TPA: hypothetical protein VLQ89_07750, partial [Candidatus Binatia bacterium]|nr:hypothetical protein [Candidatus Binatia bacterium]
MAQFRHLVHKISYPGLTFPAFFPKISPWEKSIFRFVVLPDLPASFQILPCLDKDVVLGYVFASSFPGRTVQGKGSPSVSRDR